MTDTLENQDPTAARRAEAKLYSGVTYDARVRKFAANITIGGKRSYLGSFDDARSAGAAYEIARSENPIVRKRGADGEASSFAAAYRKFLQECVDIDKVKYGRVNVGTPFMAPGGQIYYMVRVDFRKKDTKQSWVFYVWESKCNICQADFTTKTLAGKELTGMTRTCASHRGQTAAGLV